MTSCEYDWEQNTEKGKIEVQTEDNRAADNAADDRGRVLHVGLQDQRDRRLQGEGPRHPDRAPRAEGALVRHQGRQQHC